MTRKKKGRGPQGSGPRESPGHNILNEIVGLQEQAEMENNGLLKITSIVTVPDLFWRGYRHPEMSRQFIVTFNQAVNQKEFRQKMRDIFGVKGQT